MSLIHAMQNHDEITYELVHFLAHSKDIFVLGGEKLSGEALRSKILKEMESKAMTARTSYNGLSGNGLCTTFTGLSASALQVQDPWKMSEAEQEKVRRGHLLMAFYNIMQPGVFAISAWDLLGALPMKREDIKSFTGDGDWRWINRGSFDLLGLNPSATKSRLGIPRAQCLYGSVPDQLKDPKSFLSQIRSLLKARLDCGIALGKAVSVIDTGNSAVTAVLYRLPKNSLQLTVINWGLNDAKVKLTLPLAKSMTATDVMSKQNLSIVAESGEWAVSLNAWEGKSIALTI